jgi:hypothetical protein
VGEVMTTSKSSTALPLIPPDHAHEIERRLEVMEAGELMHWFQRVCGRAEAAQVMMRDGEWLALIVVEPERYHNLLWYDTMTEAMRQALREWLTNDYTP